MPDSLLQFPVLIGDIGGTNARFQIVEDRMGPPRSFGSHKVRDFDTIEDAIERTVLDRTSLWPRTVILAGAGPIMPRERNTAAGPGGGLDLTNSHWIIRPERLLQTTGVADVVLVNDFEAQAFALTALEPDDYLDIGTGERLPERNRVVLGAGTGLGVAGLVRAADVWVPVPGEGGHVDVGPRGAEEAAIWQHLEGADGTPGGRVSAEMILSGRGIINCYGAIEKATGRQGRLQNETCEPAAISAAAMDGTDDVSAEAMALFCRVLGRVAGDLALTFLARGGVYVGGGIAGKIAPLIERSDFRASFEDKAPHGEIMARIGTAIVMDPVPALKGLAAFARAPGTFGLDLERRRWRAEP